MNWDHKIFTEEEMKTLVREVYDAKIFTSLHCGMQNSMMVFMPMMFFGSAPTAPSLVSDNQVNRKNKLNHIQAVLDYEKETPAREEFIKNIGMLYEYHSEAGPRSCNGFPMFMSCKIVSIQETERFLEMYKKYEKMREDFENEWK